MMETNIKRIGIYAGTFDPYTIGHADIARRALALVDELHILIGVNVRKEPFHKVEDRLEEISTLYQKEPRVVVRYHEGIIAKYALQLGAAVLIRGVRSVSDMEQERSIADTNRNHFGVDTIFLFADSKYAHVSSTLVRELAAFGEDYAQYLPF